MINTMSWEDQSSVMQNMTPAKSTPITLEEGAFNGLQIISWPPKKRCPGKNISLHSERRLAL